ncbi:hypothetical protein [Spiroplasma melliferum]|uniref:ABC transporter substrate-binding protein n=2 Tax=Spiroplasma melliferum TaxID=2134 RepID=A0AAI9T2W3_SPIME|nr:hypothetical protein [Spiroplasma melliferum]ELL44200.1 hypothetical protein SMIPMB4A_v3c9330 [Spiroplasma melliferum IPMB4A]KAI92330.1 hypothetical protein SPM_006365 [Spiroplasma melliferum KC3]QCO23764.1 hypothetical protein SRED_002238 [Spiroplasma melliferum]
MKKVLSLFAMISVIGFSIPNAVANTLHQNQDKNIMVISSNEKQKEANKQFGIKIEYKNIEDLKPNDYYQKIKKIKTINWKKLQQSSCTIKEVL